MAPAKTRSRSETKLTPKTTAAALAASSATSQKASLAPESKNPPKLFILPKDASPEARILSLQNPRTTSKSRYLCCPSNGFYEFTRIAAPKTTPQSFLLSPSTSKSNVAEASSDLSNGYISSSADIFVATAIDPLFFLLPVLSPTPSRNNSEPQKQLFLTSDDHFDVLLSSSPHLRPLLQSSPELRSLLASRMAAVCDTVDAGDEYMYRLSQNKVLSVLLAKAQAMASSGLPTSMEEKLVRKSLEVPIISIKRSESSYDLPEEEDTTPTTASFDSQTSISSAESASTNLSEASTAPTSVSGGAEEVAKVELTPIVAPEGIPQLLRLRTALSYIFSSYIPPHLASLLQAELKSPTSSSPVHFTPLDAHLAHLSSLRQEAIRSRDTGCFSRKRGFEDEEEAELRAEKKRKKEEEEKKAKMGVSRGVKNLAKVNTTGMKKMSDFFKKKP